MLILVSGATATIRQIKSARSNLLGHLLTPRNRNGIPTTGLPWAVDNGAFSGFDPLAFRRLLRRVAGRQRLLWIACPDKVGSARETGRLFAEWQAEVQTAGPVAFVAQDGAESLPVPWSDFACLFIGGSTRWKLSEAAGAIIDDAKARGKLVHMGRVNSLRRLRTAIDAGCDSIDGSSLSMFGDKYIHKFCRWALRLEQSPAALYAGA